MASIPQNAALNSSDDVTPLGDQVRAMLKPLASLKISVAVFSLSMFLVLVGSLAQARTDIWEVVGQYFRCWVAWVDIKDLFPPAFFPSLIDYDWDGLWINKALVKVFGQARFPFFGGWTLGLVATVNLLAAHGMRFKVQAKGVRLVAGLVVLGLGLGITWFVVAGGMNADGFQTKPMLDWLQSKMGIKEPYKVVWQVFQACVVFGCAYVAWQLRQYRNWVTATVGSLIVGILYFTWMSEPLSEPSMRILWQLMKAEFASIVLLIACWLLFRKRSGVVLLHAGVAVLMLSEVMVGINVTETRFQMVEGETATFAVDIRERELVVVDNSGEKAEVVSIPEAMLTNAYAARLKDDSKPEDYTIKDEGLPFDIEVVRFYRNSSLKDASKTSEPNPANRGFGLRGLAVNTKASTGMDDIVDISTTYVRLLAKESGDDLGTYMLSMHRGTEPLIVDGKLYDLSLRFKRKYKDYSVTLIDVEKRDYVGTNTPRDYASEVRLVDEENGVDRKVRIWMNNPLRYRGETIYQTSYQQLESGEEFSAMQVVNNRGWMLPYMACMIVLTGMAVQFGVALTRYLGKRDRESATLVVNAFSAKACVGYTILALIVAGYFGSKFRVKSPKDGQANLYAFGEVPVVKGGRQQPMSSVALNRMRVLTDGKSEFQRELRESELMEDWDEISEDVAAAIPGLDAKDLKDFEGGIPELVTFIAGGTGMHEQEVYGRLSQLNFFGSKSAITRKAPALWWMLDQISGRPEARRHRVVRIDNRELKGSLNLEDRTPPLFSVAEIMENFGDLDEDLETAKRQFKKDSDSTTQYQRRLVKLEGKLGRVKQTADVFLNAKFDEKRPLESMERILFAPQFFENVGGFSDSALIMPISLDTDESNEQWAALAEVLLPDGLIRFMNEKNFNREQLIDYVLETLPEELVESEIAGMVRQIKVLAPTGNVNKMAANLVKQMDDPRLLQTLSVIAKSSFADPNEIVAGLSDDDRSRIYRMGLFNLVEGANPRIAPRAAAQYAEAMQAIDKTDPEVFSKLTAAVEGTVRTYVEEISEQAITDEQIASGPNDDAERLASVLAAWKEGETDKFNELVMEHNEKMAEVPIAKLDMKKTSFEAWYNNAAPATYGCVWYIVAFVLAAVSLIAWTRPLSRAAFTIAAVTFLFHTFALIARVYISGRPPVTNLYSSAVFIGWGAVLLGLLFELVYKSGIGNLVSSMTGFMTLFIAYYLGSEGDTFEVLQAVLDTQFWLATHVVCITLGYSATFLAGMFGLIYILKGVFTPTLREQDQKDLSRMIYGTICFAMLFSFVGTILGGLWADDSWGRFWGWDPKENGAMMIVIWNAIVMHARWDKMVKDRGMAVLSVAGNIVTAWSWFGVNELKAGLHTYGFTEGRLYWLGMFVLANLLIICIGLFPKDMWMSFRKKVEPKPAT